MTRNHGYMIYDTLFGTDANGKVKPQMVDELDRQRPTTGSGPSRCATAWSSTTASRSPARTWSPRSSAGASATRWAGADASSSARWTRPTPDTFRIFLGEPFGFMLEALGKPSRTCPSSCPSASPTPMPSSRSRNTSAPAPTSSSATSSSPATRPVYLKNAKYKPRSEPPTGTTGGKNVYVDRVEWNLASVIRRPSSMRCRRARSTSSSAGLRPVRRAQGRPEHPDVDVQPATACSTWPASTTCTSPSTTRRCARRRSPPSTRRPSCTRRWACRTCTSPAADVPLRHALRQPAGSDLQMKSNMKKAQELLQGQRLRRHAGRADEADRPGHRSTSCPTWPRSCCARPASRSTCRRWTGRRWSAAAPRRMHRTRAAGTCS